MAKIQRVPGLRDDIRIAVAALGEKTGAVGWFESSKYEDGAPVAGVAAVQEYGSAKRGIPPRPFFRPTAEQQAGAWKATAAQVSKGILQGHLKPDALMEALSLKAEADVRVAITKLLTPQLSLLTLQARKHKKEQDGSKGPVQPFTAKTLGKLQRSRDEGPPDVSGVSTKPLVDSGYLLATLTSKVE